MPSFKQEPEPSRTEYWRPHMMRPAMRRKLNIFPRHSAKNCSKNRRTKEVCKLCQPRISEYFPICSKYQVNATQGVGQSNFNRADVRSNRFEQHPDEQMLATIENVRRRIHSKIKSYETILANINDTVMGSLDHLRELMLMNRTNRMSNGKHAKPRDNERRNGEGPSYAQQVPSKLRMNIEK